MPIYDLIETVMVKRGINNGLLARVVYRSIYCAFTGTSPTCSLTAPSGVAACAGLLYGTSDFKSISDSPILPISKQRPPQTCF